MAKKKTATKKTNEENGKLAETKKAKATPKEKKPKEELVVFAFRLTQEERALIHKAAGPAKASRFVRALATAASRADEKTVSDMVKAVRESAA